MLLLSNGLKPSGAIRGANEKKALANAWKNNHIFADHNGLVHVNFNIKSYRGGQKNGIATLIVFMKAGVALNFQIANPVKTSILNPTSHLHPGTDHCRNRNCI